MTQSFDDLSREEQDVLAGYVPDTGPLRWPGPTKWLIEYGGFLSRPEVEGEDVFGVLGQLFRDVERLYPSGFIAECPEHGGESRSVLFDEAGRFLGCTGGPMCRGGL